jgi:hypothetical protein
MEEIKFVPMVTWVCVCGKEFKVEIGTLSHSMFGVYDCLPCNVKDGDRIPIEDCRCK